LFVIVLISLIGFNTTVVPIYPAAAASEEVRWTKVSIPTEGEAGNWALASGSDIQHLIAAGDGTLYACVKGPTYTLYRSTDGGYSWEHIGNVRDAITGIAISPHDAGTIYYATASEVYRSTNSGKTFVALPPNPGGAGANNREITSIDVAWLNSNIIVVGTRDTDSAEFGGVYTLDEADIIPSWEDTNISSYDVCTVAFSPDYSADRQMVAVVTDENDTYVNTKTGNAGWNAEIGYARLDIPATSAEIAFPDIDDADFIPEDIVCFVAIDTGTGEGDVYKIDGAPAPGTSTATDLNAGSAYGYSDIDITGLAAYSDNATVTLLAGAADSAMTYVSTDGGETWTRSRKAPTGGSQTGVLMAPDFSATGRMYGVTSGDGSALSISRDTGATWNQLSLVDTALDTIVDLAPSPRYSQDKTIFMLTFGSGPYSEGLWRSLDGGDTWERTLSGYPDTVDCLRRVALPPEYSDNCQTVFVAGESRGSPAIWESTDSGQSYRRRFTRDPAGGAALTIDTWAIADKTTICIGSYDGSQGIVYKTTNSGFSFVEGIPAGNQPLHSIALSPDYMQDGTMLVGNSNGRVYQADNNSTSFEPLPGDATSPPFSGLVNVAFDPAFSKNHTVYAASDTADSGVYCFVIGKSTEWESIDNTLPAGAMLNRLSVAKDGTFYAVNSDADGGIERSLNPAFASGPTFETITRGLGSGATLYGLWEADHHIWSVDTTNAKLMTYDDTLTSPPILVSPDKGASAIGNLVDHTVRNINLDWETMDGATSYEWECGYDDDFTSTSVGFEDSTSASSIRLPALEPTTTYHWRVRASSPALSPWSEKRSFTTVMDTEAVTLRPESPTAGAIGVAVMPVFQWTAVIGAEAYELLVATDADANNPVIAKTDEYALAGNVWQCDVSLDYATTYYWKVRATNASTRSAWSTTGVFTTESAPASTEPPEETLAPMLDHEVPTIKPLAANPTPVQIEPPTSPMPTTDGIILPSLSQLPSVPNWVIYLIGGLLSIVILTLIVILAIVLKIKRIA
jgi:photosystem II stability/assembly factor-like uncharacterized protein